MWGLVVRAAVPALVFATLAAAPAGAEQASNPASALSGRIAAGVNHTCAVVDDGSVRCWGANDDGQLGYPGTSEVGYWETPASAGPVDLGPGHTAIAIAAGDLHTCALLDDGTVRCWGLNNFGQLGYGNTDNVGDDETPASAGPVELGTARTAVAITAGGDRT
jgi:alpha-tubulin suppressor-like RCC1 family protein